MPRPFAQELPPREERTPPQRTETYTPPQRTYTYRIEVDGEVALISLPRRLAAQEQERQALEVFRVQGNKARNADGTEMSAQQRQAFLQRFAAAYQEWVADKSSHTIVVTSA